MIEAIWAGGGGGCVLWNGVLWSMMGPYKILSRNLRLHKLRLLCFLIIKWVCIACIEIYIKMTINMLLFLDSKCIPHQLGKAVHYRVQKRLCSRLLPNESHLARN